MIALFYSSLFASLRSVRPYAAEHVLSTGAENKLFRVIFRHKRMALKSLTISDISLVGFNSKAMSKKEPKRFKRIPTFFPVFQMCAK